MNNWIMTVAASALLIEACQAQKAAPVATRPDSVASITARSPNTMPASPIRKLLEQGDTFDLRVSTGLVLGSAEAIAKPCKEQPAVSEMLYILDTTEYAVTRVMNNCSAHATRTVVFQSTYKLVGDMVQFYEGDGNERYLGNRAVVSRDSLITVDVAPENSSRYVRRTRSGAGSHP